MQTLAAYTVGGFPLLEFDRRPIDRHHLIGFALSWNSELTLIQPLENNQFLLNGYTVFRNSDVKRCRPLSEG